MVDSPKPQPIFSRRSLLTVGPLFGAGTVACSSSESDSMTFATRTVAESDSRRLKTYSAALHVHSSFSEGPGSMQAQLAEARRMGVAILCWTDHDWRMQAVDYWREVSFANEFDEKDGDQWNWMIEQAERPSRGLHKFGVDPPSASQAPNADCLYLSLATEPETRSDYRLIATADRRAYRTSLHGQRFKIDVFPESTSENGALVFDVVTSYRPATSGRSKGRYRLSYRMGSPMKNPSREVRDGVGIITVDAPAGRWSRVSVEPALDISSLWPDIDGRDAASFELSLAVTSDKGDTATTVSGYFRSLRIERSHVEGDEPLRTQAALIDQYRDEFPEVTQITGTEISLDSPHLGAMGENLSIPDTPRPHDAVVADVHSTGGLVSYNHPFGSDKTTLEKAEREKLLAETVARLLSERALGCDMMEVGYRNRGGGDLHDHQSLWDACSRAGVFLTGLGTNDNHTGVGWDKPENNFVTWIWSPGRAPSDVLQALGSGYAFFGDPVLFAGSLDLNSASGARMGQVSVQADHGPALTVVARKLPPDSQVELLSLPMTADKEAGAPVEGDYTHVIIPATDFSEGRLDVPIESARSAMYRTIVVDSAGQTMALSNPIWLLTEEPVEGIPESRRSQ